MPPGCLRVASSFEQEASVPQWLLESIPVPHPMSFSAGLPGGLRDVAADLPEDKQSGRREQAGSHGAFITQPLK